MSQKKKIILIIVAILLVVNACFFAVYYFYLSPSVDTVVQSIEGQGEQPSAQVQTESSSFSGLSDDYYSIHFNYGDAVDLCMNEARSRNSNLIQLVVNEHSTRYIDIDKLYLVKLDSYVGTPLLYDEKEHTCHIDPKVQGVAFYQEIVRRTAVRPVE